MTLESCDTVHVTEIQGVDSRLVDRQRRTLLNRPKMTPVAHRPVSSVVTLAHQSHDVCVTVVKPRGEVPGDSWGIQLGKEHG